MHSLCVHERKQQHRRLKSRFARPLSSHSRRASLAVVRYATAFCPGLFGVWHLPSTHLLQAELHDHAAKTGTAQNRSNSQLPCSSPTRSPCNGKEKGPKAALGSEQNTCDGPCHCNVGLQRRLNASFTSGGQSAVLCRHRQQLPILPCYQP